MACKPRQLNKFLSLLGVSIGGTISFGAFCLYRGDETFYSKCLMPVVSRLVDPEIAHDACISITKFGLIRCRNDLTPEQSAKLRTRVFNLEFENPIGIAAGFDKNSLATPGLKHYGIGFTEVGTVTPQPQDGNPRKRIFRINEQKALINRCGFNNNGIDFVVDNLSQHKTFKPMLLGLNLGKNKSTEDMSSDYLVGLEKSKKLDVIDYLVINVSSPNTPGLREAQTKKNLEKLLEDVLSKMNQLDIRKPLLIKIAPDLTDSQIEDVADVIERLKCGNTRVSGIILTNTTISRPNSNVNSTESMLYNISGGLSGTPLRDMSTNVIRKFYKITGGKIPIIGVGGISSGQDAYDKIKAGASLVQLYTGLTYEGPPIINKIKRELVQLVENDQLASISEAVGKDHRGK